MCNHPLHTTSEKNPPINQTGLCGHQTPKLLVSPLLKDHSLKKASGREKSQDQEGLFSQNLGDQGGVGIWKLGSEELSVRSITTS